MGVIASFNEISEGLARLRQIYATPDDELTSAELILKRDHQAEIARLTAKFGPDFDRAFALPSWR